MNHMSAFEKSWCARHGLPQGTLKQYRFKDESGYRLPDLAKNYRTWLEAIDSVVVELPKGKAHLPSCSASDSKEDIWDVCKNAHIDAIEAAGLRWKS